MVNRRLRVAHFILLDAVPFIYIYILELPNELADKMKLYVYMKLFISPVSANKLYYIYIRRFYAVIPRFGILAVYPC